MAAVEEPICARCVVAYVSGNGNDTETRSVESEAAGMLYALVEDGRATTMNDARSQRSDITDSRLCALIRRQAERLGQERKAAGFKNWEVADAALIEAMSIAGGMAKQVRARLLGLVDEALHGPTAVEPPKPPPGASPEELAAYAEDMRAHAAALQAEADASALIVVEIERRGAGPDTPLRSGTGR